MSVYGYADESGNTGANLFDPAQPIFYSAAVISDFDIDSSYKEPFTRLASAEGFSALHAAEMGMARLANILPTLAKWIKRDNVRFFIGRIVKRDLVVAKIFDTLFDPHNNLAVPYHIYWALPLRHVGVLKLNHLVTEDILRGFWSALIESNEKQSHKDFLAALQALRSRVTLLPDQRSREIFIDAFDWAIRYPAELQFHSRQKKMALGHLPNLVSFPEMLRAIDDQASFWKQPVKRIKHDRESQIQVLLKDWHKLLSNAGDGTFRLWQQTFNVRLVSGSDFQISSSKESAGIQLADIVLWLSKRSDQIGDIGDAATSFLSRVRRNGRPFDLSMQTSEDIAAHMIAQADAELTAADLEKSRNLLEEFEAKRQEALKRFPLR